MWTRSCAICKSWLKNGNYLMQAGVNADGFGCSGNVMNQIDDIAHVIQLSIAPVFLLTYSAERAERAVGSHHRPCPRA
jgi:hypothetical protein